MYTLHVRQSFAAAHHIPGHSGKCKTLHGHTYRVEAEFSGTELNDIGMVADFSGLKKAVRSILPDHTYLNEVIGGNTTVEEISEWLFNKLKAMDLPIQAVTVWESDHCGCRYTPDDVSA